MTVSAATPIDRYTGDGSTVAFSFSYEVFDLADVVVALYDNSDPNVDKTGTKDGSGTYDYTVTGSLSGTTNRYTSVTVTFNTAPPSGWLVALTRAQDQEQDTSLSNGAAFSEKSIEFQFDKLVHMIQDLGEKLGRAVVVEPATQEITSDVSFNNSATLKNVPDPQADRDVVPRTWVSSQIAGVSTGEIQVVTSYALLTALDTAAYTQVYVTGRVNEGDGGEGWFVWDSTSTATDDDGTILESDAGGTGRWLRQYDGGVRNVKWYGAKGDGATDDTSAIQAAIDASELGGIYFPPGRYQTSSTVRIDGYNDQGDGTERRFRICSEGCLISSTLSDSDVTPQWAITDSKNVDVEGIRWSGNHVYICGLWFSSWKNCRITSLEIAERNNPEDSDSFNANYWNEWVNCNIGKVIVDTGENGVDVREFNSNSFFGCNIGQSGFDYAIEIYGDQGPQAWCFYNCDISDYDTAAIYVDEAVEARSSLTFFGGYFDTAGAITGTGKDSLVVNLIGDVTCPNDAGFESRTLNIGSKSYVSNTSGSQNGSRIPVSGFNLMRNGDLRDGQVGFTLSGSMSVSNQSAADGLYRRFFRFTTSSAFQNFEWSAIAAPFTGYYTFAMICRTSSTVGKNTTEIDGAVDQNGAVSFVSGEWTTTAYTVQLQQGEVFSIVLGTGAETTFTFDVAYMGLTMGKMAPLYTECHPIARIEGTEVTISSGVATINQNQVKLRTEGGAASDDLDTLTDERSMDNEYVTLIAADDAETVVVKHGTGNIRLNGGSDFTMNEDTYTLTLYKDEASGNWLEVARGTAT